MPEKIDSSSKKTLPQELQRAMISAMRAMIQTFFLGRADIFGQKRYQQIPFNVPKNAGVIPVPLLACKWMCRGEGWVQTKELEIPEKKIF